MSTFTSYGIFWRRLLFTLLTACVLTAIIIQDHTSYLPLGVFNTGAGVIEQLSLVCLLLAGVVLIIQLIELASGRLTRLNGMIRGAYVFLIILDVLLIFGDRYLVTGDPAGRLGQYYEVRDSGNPPVMLKKIYDRAVPRWCLSNADSTLDGPRILFLGDSYTEGSGSAPECNYVNVAGRVLREKWLSTALAVNAGVSGYGPTEALRLLRWYKDQGCPVNAVVYNLTLQNDFSDNLPGTERRVVAGIIFRFPTNIFLRTFHPLNTRVFRWALVFVFFGKASTREVLNAVTVAGGPCDLTPDSLTVLSPFLRHTVERDFDHTRRMVTSPRGYEETTRAVEGMRAIAAELEVPFFLVVFPDRVLVDRELQALMGIQAPDASSQLHGFATQMGADRVLDMYGALAGRPGMYRTVDAHLSDMGNVIAGEYVGTAIAEYMSTSARN
jgi:hypothetical protein